MKLHPEYAYVLATVEVDHLARVAWIRKAPVVEGKPDRASPFVAFVALRDAPVPPDPVAPPDEPPAAPTRPAELDDARWQQVLDAHAAASAAWVKLREQYTFTRKARADALAAQDFQAWLDDPRPDHVKADDHFAKAMGRNGT